MMVSDAREAPIKASHPTELSHFAPSSSAGAPGSAPDSESAPETAPTPASPATPEGFRSGFVCLCGRPNAGKSTLINSVLERKLLITSNVAQTTRHRFRAVLDSRDYQLILVDTPGIHKPEDLLGKELNSTATKALADVDAIAWVLDSSVPFGRGDRWLADLLGSSQLPKILVLNKTDAASDAEVEAHREAACSLLEFTDVVALSALKQRNIADFISAAVCQLPPGPRWFPFGTASDQPLEVIIAEFIREKVLLNTFAEVPHAVGVTVGSLEFLPKRGLYRIGANLHVERESQKGIIVGRGGEQLRRIGSAARVDLEHFLGARVYLDLRVKLRKNWRRDLSSIHRFGYGEGLR
ncbi:MAG: GTPase Era [Coriobacteriales bacterium]|jgi:GTP-binding protein Era|nr:GTPase Era [Coriobacteriales bacterium]